MGGLSASIHARLAGFEVLVVEKGSVPGGKAAGFNIAGYRLDPGPSIVILKDIYEDLFARAGRSIADYLRFIRLDPFTRVCFEGSDCFDLPADRKDCLDVLKARFPLDAKRMEWLMDKGDRVIGDVRRTVFARPFEHPWQIANPSMIKVGLALGGQTPYKQVVDRWFTSPELRAFFYGFPSYGGQTYDSVAPGAFLIPYLMLSEGVYYPEGGVASIPAALHRLGIDLGVEFRFDTTVTGLIVDRSRVRALETSKGPVDCDAVICNVDPYTAGAWLGRTYNLEPNLSYFTVHWGLRTNAKELSCHTLFVPKDFESGFDQLYRQRRFPDSPIVYVNATSSVDPSSAPPGCANVFAVATSPAITDELDWAETASMARQAMLKTMDKCGLSINATDVEFEREQSPATFYERDGNYRGSLYGPVEKHRLFGMMPQRNYDEEYRNLYYCGGSVQPGAGLPMVMLSGKFAVERLAKR